MGDSWWSEVLREGDRIKVEAGGSRLWEKVSCRFGFKELANAAETVGKLMGGETHRVIMGRGVAETSGGFLCFGGRQRRRRRGYEGWMELRGKRCVRREGEAVDGFVNFLIPHKDCGKKTERNR